jgi:hypothetical protein
MTAVGDDTRRSSVQRIHTHLSELRDEVVALRSSFNSSEDIAMLDHLFEALAIGEHSAKRLANTAGAKASTLRIGPIITSHVHLGLLGAVLRAAGVYGIVLASANLLYYVIAAFVTSGSTFLVCAAWMPILLTSAALFPPLFIVLELVLGVSYFTGLFSYYGFFAILDNLELALINPLLLEQIGTITIAIIAVQLVLFEMQRRNERLAVEASVNEVGAAQEQERPKND